MIIYEVNIDVDAGAAEDFAVWLRGHIREMLEIEGFEGALWFYEQPEGARQRWSIQYRVSGWKDLQQYFDTRAESMRAAALERFSGRFSAARRVLFERERFGQS